MGKFVILYGYPFTRRDWQRFGVDHWLHAGFDVDIYDLSAIFSTDFGAEERIVSQNIGRPGSVDEFAAIAHDLRGAIVYFNLPGGWTGRRVVQLAAQHGARFLRTDLGMLPRPTLTFRQRVRERTLARSFAAMLSGQFFPIVARPDIHVVTCLSSARTAVAPQKVYTHAQDYDVYLATNGAVPIVEGRYGVLLYSSHCENVDFAYCNKRAPATADRYYPAINRFLDAVEQAHGCPVVVAGHPREVYGVNHFSGRRIVQGATAALVKHAAFVVSMATTATNFAVLWRKPLFFISTEELAGCMDGAYIEAFAAALGSRAINADGNYSERELRLRCEENVYRQYEDEYIKYPGSPAANSWQTVTEAVRTF